VKLGASEKGGGLGLIGEADTTHALLQAEGLDCSLKLTTKDGKQQLIKPQSLCERKLKIAGRLVATKLLN